MRSSAGFHVPNHGVMEPLIYGSAERPAIILSPGIEIIFVKNSEIDPFFVVETLDGNANVVHRTAVGLDGARVFQS